MYITVDIGGTKTLIAVFDDLGTIVEQTKFSTPVDYEAFLQELASNVEKLSTADFAYGCVALPGQVDRKHGDDDRTHGSPPADHCSAAAKARVKASGGASR